ncbi:MAG: MFS transporter [Acetobacter sp.]|jgi:DHA1 family inner membrane transport protein
MTLPAEESVTPRSVGLAIFSLALVTFCLGSSEFALMGLLPQVANSLHVSLPAAGNAVSAYAIGVVVGAPLITLATARMSRRTVMLLQMGWFTLTTTLSAFSPNLFTLELMRFLSGLPHGTLFGGGALTAASLVPEGRRGRAVGHVFTGLTVANVVGAPLSTLAGNYADWRVSYIIIGCAGILSFLLMMRYLPKDAPRPGASVLGELAAFRRKQVWFLFATVIFGCGGMFAVYTYFSAALITVAHAPSWSIPLYQSLWGAGMVVGAYAGAMAMDRNPKMAAIGAFIWNLFVLALFALTLHSLPMVSITIFLLGGTIAVGPAMQVRLMSIAGDAQTMAASMNHAAFNMANAVGAWTGGAVLAAGLGYQWTGWAGVIIAAIGLVLFLLTSTETSARTSQKQA